MGRHPVTIAEVRLWGRTIGAVDLQEGERTATFQYDPAFARSNIEVSPLTMALRSAPYRFPELPGSTFHGLPGLLADSLPDKYGNALIDAWLASQGRIATSFNPVERLCYTANRGMGALEYLPATGPNATVTSERLDIAALVALASDILAARNTLTGSFATEHATSTLATILAVGTSAGGARAKALIAWNPLTNDVRSGQGPALPDYTQWLLKFDGVSANRDKELDDPQGFGAIEFAYAKMAGAAGIDMAECRLLAENGRRHFMTRRFDRLDGGAKLHMQSLGALAHYDFNQAGAYAYEQALLAIRQLRLPMAAVEQQFRRMVFNIVARNQDDHVKNIAFLMDRAGNWALSPAYDLTYSYNPAGAWTGQHQMTVNNKRQDFTIDDLRACANVAAMKRGRAESIHDEVRTAVRSWPHYASEAGVDEQAIAAIGVTHRLDLA